LESISCISASFYFTVILKLLDCVINYTDSAFSEFPANVLADFLSSTVLCRQIRFFFLSFHQFHNLIASGIFFFNFYFQPVVFLVQMSQIIFLAQATETQSSLMNLHFETHHSV